MISDILIGTLVIMWIFFGLLFVNWLCLNNGLATSDVTIKKYYVTVIGNLTVFFGGCIALLTGSLILIQVYQ